MSEQLTEIIFLLDRSGSMAGLEEDTIGGFNAFIEKQTKLPGQTQLTTILFDHAYEILWDGIDAKDVKLTNEDYFVRGTTALLDAIGKTIITVRQRLSLTKGEGVAPNVIFVITTDGMENASSEFSYEKVKELINYQQKHEKWEFIFMGANIDVAQEAGNIGIDKSNAFVFEASEAGVQLMYEKAHQAVTAHRTETKK